TRTVPRTPRSEILRHQVAVLQRQVKMPKLSLADPGGAGRAGLAAAWQPAVPDHLSRNSAALAPRHGRTLLPRSGSAWGPRCRAGFQFGGRGGEAVAFARRRGRWN